MTSAGVRLIERPELARDLAALELPPNEIYLIHSSLRRVGQLANGPAALVDALRDTCGRRSTLVAPAFTADNSTTSRAYRRRTAGMTPRQLLTYEAEMPGFDPAVTPSQNVGVVAECIRRNPDSVRSQHPQTSFTAIGPHAEELLAVHALDCHLGEKSPLGQLYEHDAVVLLIGVGFAVCTCFHLAEYRLDRAAPLRLYRTHVLNGGRRELHEFIAPETNDGDFARIGDEMARQPFVHVGRVGNALVFWFRLRHGVDYALHWMNHFR